MSPKQPPDFKRFNNTGLVKSSDLPVQKLTAEQKASLNRKGNTLFNEGDVESARRIFVTTGYSDGLTRVGDFYAKKGRSLDALKMYWLAHNRRKADALIEKMACLIKALMIDEQEA